MAAAVQPSQPPHPVSLTPEERARVEAYRVQFRAMGLTDDDIARMNEPTDVTVEEELAFLDGRGPDPWPR